LNIIVSAMTGAVPGCRICEIDSLLIANRAA
jgi:hypothetical protein